MGAREIWIYGEPTDSRITDFSVADTSTGSTIFTNDRTVNVSLTAIDGVGLNITGYMINEDPVAPYPEADGWSSTVPPIYAITGPEGTTTIYAWVKDSSGYVAGKSASILLQAPDPVVSNVMVFGNTDTTAFVTWKTNFDTLGRIRYRMVDDMEWIDTAWETTARTSHSKMMTDLVLDWEYEFIVENNESSGPAGTYTHTGAAAELPKNEMVATASSIYANNVAGYGPMNAINGSTTDDGWLADGSGTDAWLRLDFGFRCLVQRYRHYGRGVSHGWIKDYEIYVTDSPSSSKADWGVPAAAGRFANDRGPFDVNLNPTVGRCLICFAVNVYGGAGASEVWAYGIKLAAGVAEFEVADQTSGSTQHTNARTIDVTKFVGVPMLGQQLTGWMTNEFDVAPDANGPGWQTSPPATYTIEGDDNTDVTVYGWVRDSLDNVGGWHATILLNLSTPNVSDLLVAADTPTSVRAYFATDSETYAFVKWTEHGTENWQASAVETAHGTSHAVRFTGLVPESIYDVIIVNNEKEDPMVVYNHLPGYSGYHELDKLPMMATASSSWGGFPPETAINGVTENNGGWLSEGGTAPQWLRIDLGDSYLVQQAAFQPRNVLSHGPILKFELYLTDVLSDTKADWGEPVAYGGYWQAQYVLNKVIPLPNSQGRYLILYATQYIGSASVAEAFIWGKEGRHHDRLVGRGRPHQRQQRGHQ